MKKTMILLLLICSVVPCFARLGETIDQSIARYGQPLDAAVLKGGPNSESMFFLKNDFLIYASFFKGVCVDVMIQHTNPVKTKHQFADGDEETAEVPALTMDEAQVLLDQNGRGKVWTINKNSTADYTIWDQADGGGAMLDSKDKLLTISSPDDKLLQQDQQKESVQEGDTTKAKKEVQGL